MKYRKKPVVIDAVQWTGANKREIFDFLTNNNCPEEYMTSDLPIVSDNFYVDKWKVPGGLVIKTLEGNIWRILVIISSAVFTVNFIRVNQIYSEKLMRRWKYE